MYALKYFAGNIECQGGEGRGEWGVGEEEEEEEEGGIFKVVFLCVNSVNSKLGVGAVNVNK